MPPKKAAEKSKKEFVWSDDESELLLSVANDYKTAKAAECVDWESVKSKYNDIFELLIRGCYTRRRYNIEDLSSQERGNQAAARYC